MAAHRKTTPGTSYHLQGTAGPLLPGYDYINDPVANGFAGKQPAPADSQLSIGTHPNRGTYYIGFNEDGTSSAGNRAHDALAENFDLHDNQLNEKLPRITRVTGTAGVGGLASIAIVGNVFVGPTGTANNQNTRDRLISVLDENDNEVLNAAGITKIVASLVHDGASNNVIGSPADGFYTNPTITFNEPVPQGTNYRIYYGVQSSLAEMVEDFKFAYFGEQLRSLHEVPALVMRQLAQLHAPASAQTWDAAWDITIRALGQRGLDGAYRLSSTVPGSLANYNEAGVGALINRDGYAPRVGFEDTPIAFDDPINAHWVALDAGLRGNFAQPISRGAAPTGFVAYTSRRQAIGNGSNEEGGTLFASSFLSVWPHDFTGTITDAKTQVTPALNAVKKPSAEGSDTALIQLNAANFFHQGGVTSVAVGYDLLEVTRATGDIETYIIVGLDAAKPRVCRIANLGGQSPPGGDPVDEVVQCRWISLLFQQGGGTHTFHEGISPSAAPAKWDSFFHAAPPALTDDPATNEILSRPAEFFSNAVNGDPFGGGAATAAIVWGGFNQAVAVASYEVKGKLFGDGKVEATQYGCGQKAYSTNTSDNVTWNPREEGALLELVSTATVLDHTIDLDLDVDYTPSPGDRLFVMVQQSGDATSHMDVDWPPGFTFSGADANPTSGVDAVCLYSGIYVAAQDGLGNPMCLMTKTAY